MSLAVKRAAGEEPTAPVMRKPVLWRCSLTPGATRRRGGGSKAARCGKKHLHQSWNQNILLRTFGGGSTCQDDNKIQRLRPGRDLQERQQRMSGCLPASPFPPRCHGGPAQTPVRITLVSSLTRALFGMSSPLVNRLPTGSGAQTPGADTLQHNTTTTIPLQLHSYRKIDEQAQLLLKEADRRWLGGPYCC